MGKILCSRCQKSDDNDIMQLKSPLNNLPRLKKYKANLSQAYSTNENSDDLKIINYPYSAKKKRFNYTKIINNKQYNKLVLYNNQVINNKNNKGNMPKKAIISNIYNLNNPQFNKKYDSLINKNTKIYSSTSYNNYSIDESRKKHPENSVFKYSSLKKLNTERIKRSIKISISSSNNFVIRNSSSYTSLNTENNKLNAQKSNCNIYKIKNKNIVISIKKNRSYEGNTKNYSNYNKKIYSNTNNTPKNNNIKTNSSKKKAKNNDKKNKIPKKLKNISPLKVNDKLFINFKNKTRKQNKTSSKDYNNYSSIRTNDTKTKKSNYILSSFEKQSNTKKENL